MQIASVLSMARTANASCEAFLDDLQVLADCAQDQQLKNTQAVTSRSVTATRSLMRAVMISANKESDACSPASPDDTKSLLIYAVRKMGDAADAVMSLSSHHALLGNLESAEAIANVGELFQQYREVIAAYSHFLASKGGES